MHDCQLCRRESPVRFADPAGERGWVATGSGEIHVTGSDGQMYAAPTLILHYIAHHSYVPPQAFLTAVSQ